MVVGVRLNILKRIDKDVLIRFLDELKAGGARLISDAHNCEEFGCEGAYGGAMYRDADIIIAFGGDGTILSAARSAAPYEKPVLGVNFGHLGFLTQLDPNDVCTSAKKLLTGDYSIEKRMMIEALLPDGRTCLALNDIVVNRGYAMTMLHCDSKIDGALCDSFGGDGVIVSTATGSTAYCLSCGGPVISPKLSCMVVAPICSHSLRSRPIVISPEESVTITVSDRGKSARIDADGVFSAVLKVGQSVTMYRSEKEARFIKFEDRNFYALLRSKLSE